ncbi:hypothetical protein EV2_002365 [Malus domestica]
MVPNKSFNSKASPTKASTQKLHHKSFTHKSFTYKSLTHKSLTYKSLTHKSLTHKNLTYKSLTHKSLTYKSLTHKNLTHKSVTYKSLTHKSFNTKASPTIVAVDYYTKWAEVEPLATITEAKIENFLWKNILCRFGIPNAIITDNERQFDNNKFMMFCSKFNINLCFASPAHPQSNGQVEAINKIIKRTLKTSLDKAKGCWPEFVPQVLSSYHTSYRTSTGETPFSLTFGTEAVVLIELEQATFRVQNYV